MATGLTKKQKEALTDKIAGMIKNSPALRMTLDSSVNEMNINQISGELNRIHYRAIGKEFPAVIDIPVRQLGSGDPSPDNIRPIVGYEIDGIGTVYGGGLNIDTGMLTSRYGFIRFNQLSWTYVEPNLTHVSGPVPGLLPGVDAFCNIYKVTDAYVTNPVWIAGNYLINVNRPDDRMRVKDTRYANTDEFVAEYSDDVLVYVLATPETYTLSPQQMLQLLDQL